MEDYIKNMYNSIGFYLPHQLYMEIIASRLGVTIIYLPYESVTVHDLVLIDNRITEREQWQDFGHELCHIEWHDGNQRVLPSSYSEYREWKASNFAYHACVPTFMLDRMILPRSEAKAIWKIQEKFGVESDFAKKRLHQYLNNQIQHFNWV